MENSSILSIYKQMRERSEGGFPTWKTPIFRLVYYYIYLLGAVFVYFLLKTKVTPNQVSVTWWLTGLAGIILITIPNLTCIIIGIIILYSADALDAVDGEIARRKKMTSLKGHFLDVCGTTLINIGLMVGVGCFAYNQTGYIILLYITIIALFTKAVRFYNIASRVILIEVVELSKKQNIQIKSSEDSIVAAGHLINKQKGLRRKIIDFYYYLESPFRYLILTLLCIELITGLHFSVGILILLTLVNILHIAMELYTIFNKRWIENIKEIFIEKM